MNRRPIVIPSVARNLLLVLTLALLGAAASCSEGTAPETRAEGDLNFVRFSATAPKILDTTVTFWAKKGQNAEIRLRYAPGTEEFLRFEIPGNALNKRPDGSVMAEGDSILITVTVADLSKMIFEFQPSGLRFNPDHPARLKIEFSHGDEDLDDNGVVDAVDLALRANLGIWRREHSGDPWQQINNVLKLELDEAEADIFGFTTFALAY